MRNFQDDILLDKTISDVFGFPFRIGHDAADEIDQLQLHKELLAVGAKTNLSLM